MHHELAGRECVGVLNRQEVLATNRVTEVQRCPGTIRQPINPNEQRDEIL